MRYGYAHMTEARFLFLRVKDPAPPARGCGRRRSRRPPARLPGPGRRCRSPSPAKGSEALGVPAGALQGFSAEFLIGLAGEESRSRRLGDVGAEQPGRLAMGRAGQRAPPGGPALRRAGPARAVDVVRHARAAGPPPSRCSRLRCRRSLDGVEPFGFVDGISQPMLDWEQRRSSTGATTCSSTATSWPSARSCSATRTSTGSTPTARWSTGDDARGADLLPPRRTRPSCAISAATAAIWSCASCARTCRDSGSSCSGRRTAIPRRGRVLAEAMVGRARRATRS